jgi:hypothetical protein
MPVDQPQAKGQDQSPDDQLTALRQSLDKNQQQIAGLNKDRDALNAEVGAFSPVVDDVKKVLAAYTAAYAGLAADTTSFDNYDESKMAFVLCKVTADRRKQVDGIVADYDTNEVGAKKTAADNAAAASTKAQADSDKARADYQTAQDAYTTLKGLQATLTGLDTSAKGLTSEIDGYDAKKTYEPMYLRLKDAFEPSINQLRTGLVPADTFKTQLYKAAGQVHEAWKTARDKKSLADTAASAAASAQAAYAAAVANRKAELLKRVAALPPVPPPPPPAKPEQAQAAHADHPA